MFVFTIAFLILVAYTLVMFLISRTRELPALANPFPDLSVVFVIPALNEAEVLGDSISRLLAICRPGDAVLVVDDGSDDGTAEVARSYLGERVWLLRRHPPECRQGKGAVLNEMYRFVSGLCELADRDTASVLMCVVDADGRLDPNVLDAVLPYFAEPRVGAVQIGVRMYNRDDNLLTRMQDVEFVCFTEVFQRSRDKLASAGLGGNGQFTRLSALQALGDEPWSDCLTEDLDVGIRLVLSGSLNRYTPDADVAQQAIPEVGRLVRQRARWFQGYIQCRRLIRRIRKSPATTARQRTDLRVSLLLPWYLLFITPALVISLFLVTAGLALLPDEIVAWGFPSTLWHFLLFYGLGFGLGPVFGYIYWRRTRHPFVRSVGLGHVYLLYGYIWVAASWWGTFDEIRGRKHWAKTARETAAQPGQRAAPDLENAA
ncbi:MAG: Beta-monoglucosyldiacylglycerol synthase [Acidimicrobiales bacterium]|nr:Beta-monoglucosyldiacylglycerol synthase [Acidimicrobiales bacterium]